MIFTCKLQIFFCFFTKKVPNYFYGSSTNIWIVKPKNYRGRRTFYFLKTKFWLHKKNKKQTINDEIQLYKNLKIEKIDYSVFWTDNELRLPKLRKFVQLVCFGSPIRGPSERDFNMGTDIISSKRNSIFDNRVEF